MDDYGLGIPDASSRPGRKVTGALKIVHEKFQKTDLYSNFLDQFSDAVTKNEFIEAHLRKVSANLYTLRSR
jgi:hypothetical protein